MKFKSGAIVISGIICCCFTRQPKVKQIDISDLLNARPVTTLTNGKLITWTKGIDGNGSGDGYLTHSAAVFNGDKDAHDLPDDATFTANERHPEIKLHYNNADSNLNQARYVSGAGEFNINVPKDHYSQIYLGLSSAEGPSSLQFELIYKDGTEVKSFVLPDYYNNISINNPDFSYIATDLAKWGNKNNMTEKDHHNIHLLKLDVNNNRKLTRIKVTKSAEGYLMFWSATAIIN